MDALLDTDRRMKKVVEALAEVLEVAPWQVVLAVGYNGWTVEVTHAYEGSTATLTAHGDTLSDAIIDARVRLAGFREEQG